MKKGYAREVGPGPFTGGLIVCVRFDTAPLYGIAKSKMDRSKKKRRLRAAKPLRKVHLLIVYMWHSFIIISPWENERTRGISVKHHKSLSYGLSSMEG